MSFRLSRLGLAISAKGISFFGDMVATVALTFRVAPHGAVAVAALLAGNLLPIVLLSGVAGRLADSVDERLLLVVTGGAQALLCGALVVAPGLVTVYVLVALLGAGQAVNGATWQAVVPALAPPGRLAWALSRSQMATTVAGIAAPALGGVLTGAAGTRVPLLVDVASFVALAVAGMALGRVRAAPDPARDTSGGWAIARRSPLLRAVLTMLFWMLVLGSLVNVVEVFLIRDVLHAGATTYGLCGGIYSGAAFLGALLAGRWNERGAQITALMRSGALLGVGLALMGLSPSIAWLVGASVLTGFANGALNVALSGVLLGAAEPDQRGRVGAVVGATVSGGQLVAYVLAGALASVTGPRELFVAAGLASTAIAMLRGPGLHRAGRAAHQDSATHVGGAGRGTDPTLTGRRRALPLPCRSLDAELARARREVALHHGSAR